MNRLLVAVGAGTLALFVAIVVYFTVIRGDTPDAFELTDATEQADDSAESDGDDQSGASDSDAGSGDSTGADETTDGGGLVIDGTWTVAVGSEAGYRVVEDLRGITDFEAVGRTDQVTGNIEISGDTITAASFEADIASMDSDDGTRDGQFRGAIMNAQEFPTATLTLTEPIMLDQTPADGNAVSATGIGQLTLRGVTNAVEIPVDAQLLGDQIEIVASIDVLFSDYGIDNPSNRFVTVRDEGKVEVRLLLDKS